MKSIPSLTVLTLHLPAVLSFAAIVGITTAQCALEAVAIARVADADGEVAASALWDPDGAGPQPQVVVLGGSFRVLGTATSPGLALYEPVSRQYSTLGTGIAIASGTASIRAIAILSNNDLVVAGTFASIDGVVANNIARWDGSQWHAMAGGFGAAPLSVPMSLTTLPNGDLVAGGTYASAQRWDGTVWSPMDAGLTAGATVRVVSAMPNGHVVAGGHGLVGTAHLATWDGAAWSAWLADTDDDVFALQLLPNGDLVVAGLFTSAGGVAAPAIARWNGSAWSALGGGLSNGPSVWGLARLPNGDIIAGGQFTLAGGLPARQVARWDGAAWWPMGNGLGHPHPADERVLTLQVIGGEVIAGGRFVSDDRASDRVARWDGSAWGPLSTGSGGSFFDSAQTASGDLVVVGDFTAIEGVAANRIAVGSGTGWQALGSGIDDGEVRAVLSLPTGDIVVGGTFTSAGGVVASKVARWDGTAWHALGGGLAGTVLDLAFHSATGQILATGWFVDGFAVWDGQAWNGTGVAQPVVPNFTFNNLVTTQAGDVLAFVDRAVSRWTGSGWSPLTPMTFSANSGVLAVLANGDFAVARLGILSRWNGTAWTNLPSPPIAGVALMDLPNGDLLIGSSAATASPGHRLARWDGTAWTQLGGATTGLMHRLRRLDDGRVVAAGTFTNLFDVTSAGLAEIRSTCPSTVVPIGMGCTGSGGLNQLTATSLPWIDATFTSVATGMPSGVAVEVLGLGPTSLPIVTVLPEALPGCVLTTTPDGLIPHPTQGGTLHLAVAIPNVPAFVGVGLWQQVVAFELDPLGAFVEITSTNSLQTVLGSF